MGARRKPRSVRQIQVFHHWPTHTFTQPTVIKGLLCTKHSPPGTTEDTKMDDPGLDLEECSSPWARLSFSAIQKGLWYAVTLASTFTFL